MLLPPPVVTVVESAIFTGPEGQSFPIIVLRWDLLFAKGAVEKVKQYVVLDSDLVPFVHFPIAHQFSFGDSTFFSPLLQGEL